MGLFDRTAARSADERRAVVDIGSNTVRLVIYGGPPRAPEILHNEKVSARLGKNVVEDGVLSKKAMAAALSALRRYAALLKATDTRETATVATAAVRDAGNGMSFLAAVAETGLNPVLLSGQAEAEIGALGVLAAFPGESGIVADLGGGSLELTEIDGNASNHGASFPFGSLRLPLLRALGAAKFARRIHREIARAQWDAAGTPALFLVGGSHRALARYAIHHFDWPIDDPHGFTMSHEQALQLCRTIQRRALPAQVSGISASRLAALPDTAALLTALIRNLNPSRVVFSAWGLREGLLAQSARPGWLADDPLIAGVADFTETVGISASTAAMAADWTAAVSAGARAGRGNVRLVTTMLAMAACRIEPNLRLETAMNWALRKRWIGIDAADRAMIAAGLAASCGQAVPDGLAGRLASDEQLHEARGWGLAFRLCRQLSGLSPDVLARSSLTIDAGQLVLAVRDPWQALCGDGVDKALRTLAQHLNLQPSFA